MTRRQIEELLNQHADRLVAGQSTAPAGAGEPLAVGDAAEPNSLERAGLSADEQRALSSLTRLARRVQTVLVDVEARPGFVVDLKSRLIAERRAQAQAPAARGQAMLWLAGLAGALSVAGLGFLSYRAARAGAGWISAAAANRNARPSLPKA